MSEGNKGVGATILAVSSSGGHWEQLMLIKEAFNDNRVVYATTLDGLASRNGLDDAFLISDCNRDAPFRILVAIWQILRIVMETQPDVVVSTGAAPGIIAICIGRLFGARTIWVDSIANAEKLSLSGRLAGVAAHVQLTQWAHLARKHGPHYAGSVL